MQALRRVSIHKAMFWQIGAKPLHPLKAVGGKLSEKTLPAKDGQFLQTLQGAPAFTAWEGKEGGRGLTLVI